MGRLLCGLLGLVATLQVLVARAPRVSGLLQVQQGGRLLQGGSVLRQVGPGNSIIIQAHPGAADGDVGGETTTPTSLWNSPTGGGGGGGLEVEAGVSPPPPHYHQEKDTSLHSTATLQQREGGTGGSEQLASRMVTSGSGGTEEAGGGGGGDGGGAGSRTSHDEHRNVATPTAPRRRPGRSPGAPPAPRGADGGSSTPALPSPIPPQEGRMAERSAPNQYNSNNNLGSTTAISGTTPPPPPEATLHYPVQDVAAVMPPPEVHVDDVRTGTIDLAAAVDTSRSQSSSSDEDEDASIVLPEPTLAPSTTRRYYTYPPGLRPNLAYFGFIVYDTTPGYHGNTHHVRGQSRDTTVWIAILSVACFLAGIMIATIVCYAIYRRKWRPAPNQHPEDALPVSDDLDDLLCSSDTMLTDDPANVGVTSSGSCSSRAAHGGSTEQLLPVVAGSTDLELLTCSQTNLLQCDVLSDVHDNPGGGGHRPSLHRHPTAQEHYHQQQEEEGAGDLSTQRRSSRGGSTSTCSRSSCSTCSTVLTLDSPGLAEDGGVRRSSSGSAPGDSPGGYSWGQTSSGHGSVSTDNGYFTPGGCSLLDWTSET